MARTTAKTKQLDKVNKFIPKKIVDICGFRLRQYDCLLQRERIHLFKEKERIYSQVHSYWQIIVKYAEKKGIDYETAILQLQNATEEDVELVPYLLELANTKAQSQFNDIEYGISIIVCILTSRLENKWLEDNKQDLAEAFELTIDDIDYIIDCDINERLIDENVSKYIRQIVENLPTESYEQLLDFCINEETSANKLQTNKEKIDTEQLNDPKY